MSKEGEGDSAKPNKTVKKSLCSKSCVMFCLLN